MYERVNVNCARENSTGDWESGIHNFIFQFTDYGEKSIDRTPISHYNLMCARIPLRIKGKIPRQLSRAQYTTGGRLGVKLCQM